MGNNSLTNQELFEIENILGITFNNKQLLIQAFTHDSYNNNGQEKINTYQRLEFLGDAFLDYYIAIKLMYLYPRANEGELTAFRATLVNTSVLAGITKKLNLVGYLRIGKNADYVLKSEKIQADIFESVIGAILIDNDYDSTKVSKFIDSMINYKEIINNNKILNYKAYVLELCAKNKQSVIFDCVNDELIKDNKHQFTVNLVINNRIVASAIGNTKKEAEFAVSKQYYLSLNNK
ncbi:MAG: ribonuclease III [Clostridia bacterium]|nr:ribonuclease III [Clostridia bacterium]